MNVEVVSELIVVVVEMWRRRGGQEEESGGGDEVDLGSEADGMRDRYGNAWSLRTITTKFPPACDNYLNCANLTIRQQDSCCVMLLCYKSGECFTVYSMRNDTEDSASICCG